MIKVNVKAVLVTTRTYWTDKIIIHYEFTYGQAMIVRKIEKKVVARLPDSVIRMKARQAIEDDIFEETGMVASVSSKEIGEVLRVREGK